MFCASSAYTRATSLNKKPENPFVSPSKSCLFSRVSAIIILALFFIIHNTLLPFSFGFRLTHSSIGMNTLVTGTNMRGSPCIFSYPIGTNLRASARLLYASHFLILYNSLVLFDFYVLFVIHEKFQISHIQVQLEYNS